MKLIKWNGQSAGQYYVLNKGNRAGAARLEPWAAGNCYAVTGCSNPAASMAKWNVLQGSGKFDLYIIGSVIPFIRKRDLLSVYERHHIEPKHLAQVTALEKLIGTTQAQLDKQRELLAAYRQSVTRVAS